MIDTVVLRFHGILAEHNSTLKNIELKNKGVTTYVVDEHHQLYKKMLKYKNKFFYKTETITRETTSVGLMSDSDFISLQSNKNASAFRHIQNVMRFEDEKKVKEINARITGKYNVPSSTSSVVFNINENGDFIEFNFSIPKYLFGHSLAQFIPQAHSSRYLTNRNLDLFNEQIKILHLRLMKFIDGFLEDLVYMFNLDVYPNKNYIEIRRIDICFNQYFKNKKQALNYLEHQRKILYRKKTHANKDIEEFESSLTYFSQSGAYFKIYHKGTEYVSTKGDLKKHMDFNRAWLENYLKKKDLFEPHFEKFKDYKFIYTIFEKKVKGKTLNLNQDFKDRANETMRSIKKLQPFKVDFLKEQMDCVLRYELSLRGDFFSYNFKTKFFKPQCEQMNYFRDIYKYVLKSDTAANPEEFPVNSEQRKIHKAYHSFINSSISFTLSSDPLLVKYNLVSPEKIKIKRNKFQFTRFYKYTILSLKHCAPFSNEFLKYCIEYFLKIVKTFQLKKLDTFKKINEQIKVYNSKVKERVDLYNNLNHYKTIGFNGKPKIKGSQVILRATQLLTQKEKRQLKLKTINELRLTQVLREMELGYSLDEIRKILNITPSTFSRLKQDLEMFGIFKQTLRIEVDFIPDMSFGEYYFRTGSLEHQQKFFRKPKFINYG